MSGARLFGVALLVVAAAIIGKQSGARSCPQHSRIAGGLAWLLALACIGAGVLLIVVEPF